MSPKLYNMLDIIDDGFYSKVYNVDLLKNYLTLIIREVMKINGLSSNIKFYISNTKDNAFGSFSHRRNSISVNRRYFKLFEYFKESHNLFYIYKLVDTIIHELRHYMQYSPNVDNPAIIKNYVRCTNLATAIYTNTHTSYNLLEIDARYYCYQLFRLQPKTSFFVNSSWYERQENSRKNENSFSIIDYLANLDNNLLFQIDTNSYKKTLIESLSALLKINLTYKMPDTSQFSAIKDEGEKIYHAIAPLFAKEKLDKNATNKDSLSINKQVHDFLLAFRRCDEYLSMKKEEERC